MVNPAWVDDVAQGFFMASGIVGDTFPRDLEAAALLGWPLAIIILPNLNSQAIDDWFAQRGHLPPVRDYGVNLCGCLVASRGKGIIFLNGSVGRCERVFSLAHEIAHFLVHYLRVRSKAISRFGGEIVDVLEGKQRASVAVEVSAAIADIPLGVYWHFFDYNNVEVAHFEGEADLLAIELLAPASAALPVIDELHATEYEDRIAELSAALSTKFGLPRNPARSYAARLLKHSGEMPSLASWLGMSNFPHNSGKE